MSVATPKVGSAVYVIGSPKALEGTFSTGVVSAIRELEGRSFLQVSAPISGGSSGGPVLNSEGAVIGVAVATLRDGQNLNFAVPARYLSDLMNKGDQKILIDGVLEHPADHKQDSRILVEELWGSIYTMRRSDKFVALDADWMERLGYYRCVFPIADAEVDRASIEAIKVGPFNGTFKVTVPLSREVIYEYWNSRVGEPKPDKPDSTTKESDIQFHCLSWEAAVRAVRTLESLRSR